MILEVYDIETLSNLFTYTGYSKKDKTFHQFVIHRSRNDAEELYQHLFRDDLIMVGYNNEKFDYPVIHHFIKHYEEYQHLDGQELAQRLYKKAQEVIAQEFTAIADRHKYIPQIDLFLIWHFDNRAKSTSLKDLEVAMQLENVEDMPFGHGHWASAEDIPSILGYNKNDVYATDKFLDATLGNTNYSLYKGKNKIELRQRIIKDFNIKGGMNFNDIKLGTELILKLYCDKFGIESYQIRRMKTPRPLIKLGDCVPKWMHFDSPEFLKLIDQFRKTNIYDGETKGKVDFSVVYNGIKIDYGTGGAHACIRPGVYIADDYLMILDVDIDGMYPNLAISQGLYPEHLGYGFLDIYGHEIVGIRMAEKKKPKKERDFVIMEGYKLAANGTYGKTNEFNSWLYDPLYAMKTTISGQILISMWIEMICSQIPEIQILQVNTDGWTMLIPRKYHEKALAISDDLMKLTNMSYEANEYDKMVIRDVNNYSARYVGGGIKHKGTFEIDKEYHKDPSMRIVPFALEKYFFDAIPVDQTIREHKDIFDFCLRMKTNSTSKSFIKSFNSEGQLINTPLSKTTRYYISNTGGALLKQFESGNISGVNVGYNATIFNQYIDKPIDQYDINYNFYIKECNKIINTIDDRQLTLF